MQNSKEHTIIANKDFGSPHPVESYSLESWYTWRGGVIVEGGRDTQLNVISTIIIQLDD